MSNTIPGGLVGRYALSPERIEEQSLALVRRGVEELFADENERQVATRMLYAAGDIGLADALRFSQGAVAAGVEALLAGSPIVTDVRMVSTALDTERAAALGCTVHCAIDDPNVIERARITGTTRAIEAIRLLAPQLDGSIAVIGNAPTALLSLLDLIDTGVARPRIIIGQPVGFVAAAEAKSELMQRSVPFTTVAGTRGGSALAAAALNAMLRLARPFATPAPNRARVAALFVGHGSRAPDAAEAMLAAVEGVRKKGLFPIVESGYLELAQPDIPTALRACVRQGAARVLVIPYFLNNGMHIRRDIPNMLREEVGRYPGIGISIGRPIGLHADFANVMIAGALEAEQMPDLREQPEPAPDSSHSDAPSVMALATDDGDE